MDFLDKMAAKQPTNTDLQTQRERQNQAAPVECPIGAMPPFAGSADSADGRWLICDGRILKQDEYPELYLVISTNFNIGGEAAGQFRIPDTRGRVIVGAGQGTGLTNRLIGSRFGEETHLLTANEMPIHAHTASVSSSGHQHTGTTGGENIAHQHSFNNTNGQQWQYGAATGNQWVVTSLGSYGDWTAGPNSAHAHSFTTGNTADATAVSIGNAGLSTTHNNMQPSLAVSSIIRAF